MSRYTFKTCPSENVLHRWKREAIDGQSNSELEVEKLRQRLKQVEMERDILKKAR